MLAVPQFQLYHVKTEQAAWARIADPAGGLGKYWAFHVNGRHLLWEKDWSKEYP